LAASSVPRAVLCGGGEFTPENQVLDRAWLSALGIRRPRVILIAAASHDPARRARTGVRFLGKLGADVVPAYLDANVPLPGGRQLNDALIGARAIYLIDGNPATLNEALHQGQAAELLRQAFAEGVTVIGSGAGAMALCEHFWNGEGWEEGLGLLRGIAVLPHHERIAARFPPERLRRGLPETTVILGLEEVSGILIEGVQGRVLGTNNLTLYSANDVLVHRSGQKFTLSTPIFSP